MNREKSEKGEFKIDERIVFDEEDPKKILDYIKSLSDNMEVSSSQMRNIFDQVKSLKTYQPDEIKKNVFRLIIMVEYAKNKELTQRYKNFYMLILNCLEYLMNNPQMEKYKRFEEFLEALIAFLTKRRGDR